MNTHIKTDNHPDFGSSGRKTSCPPPPHPPPSLLIFKRPWLVWVLHSSFVIVELRRVRSGGAVEEVQGEGQWGYRARVASWVMVARLAELVGSVVVA